MITVLIAEDEPALRQIFCEVVRSLGHECIAAGDGREAIELARKHLPQVVVTDYMMPGRTGIEVLRAVHADPVLQKVPVILLSAGRPPERERSEAWRFLPKPVDLERFEKVLAEAVRTIQADGGAPAGFTAAVPAHVSPLSHAREEMLGWVSHEIKSPLSVAINATQLAIRNLDRGETTDLPRRLSMTLRQLHRIDELVNTLLDAAQLQDGHLEIGTGRVDVVALVRDVAAFWKESHAEVDFELKLHEAKAVVLGDAERLRQVFDNLVSNAIKYGSVGGTKEPIVVTVRADATHVVASVMDRGAGIAKDQIAQIFDRFHRVPGQGGRGHGLGLYIAAALARLHGGAITVDSEPQRGSTFIVTLPLARAISDELAAGE